MYIKVLNIYTYIYIYTYTCIHIYIYIYIYIYIHLDTCIYIFLWTVIIAMQYLFMLMDSEQRLNFCRVFLLIYVLYHVTFYSVVEIPTLPHVVFNSLMLYNSVSILYVLSGEFYLKLRI